ncbi:hypothetical protein C7431_102185 [Pantoea allii]|uniref:Lipoprotein n=1 Tax=Pantoea allii TaxID=574096 RepID=A0A2V2BDF2_9GAMM|nr:MULTISPECIES: hypothetical protein [Pantoea]MCH9297466.1 hypothetical protein [Pantoea allii]MDJ0035115.1 hypothetical protein [Pantoea allii]MDJ0039520.1 hypothetical protein [Pantoea allii]NQS85808.1 hypothetical protein [Pantoea allii]PWK99384.1 hypothetical protein C7431_102185 [Pantoea allii]
MKKSMKWFAALAVVGALAGCARTAPLEKIHTTLTAGHTQDQVKNAILKAGVQRQWIMTQVAPGEIKARQQVRDHMAEVRITYSATGYDILYDHSTNLLASGGQIHKSYNRWVQNLDKDIQVNLSAGANL